MIIDTETRIDRENREIFAYGISEDNSIDSNTASFLIYSINQFRHKTKEPLLIHFGTTGGDWSDGMSIYTGISFLNQNYAPVIMLGYGILASMGSVIFQAAKTRILMPYVDVMLHFGSLCCEGSTLSTEACVEANKFATEKMIDIYAEQCINGPFFRKKSYTLSRVRSYIKRQMKNKGDWWIAVDEAVDYGLADGILGDPKYPNIERIKNDLTK